MSIKVKSIFGTLQGEGSKVGTPSVFVRLSGCNLWSGKEDSRATGKGHCADWCDTEFYGGKSYGPSELWNDVWKEAYDYGVASTEKWLMVITGGEPLLQLNSSDGLKFLSLMKSRGVIVAVETNGTVAISGELLSFLDHITVSPKPIKGSDCLDHIVVRNGTDLKVIGGIWSEEALAEMNGWNFEHRFIQPLDPTVFSDAEVDLQGATELAVKIGWRVSVQTHKLLGLE